MLKKKKKMFGDLIDLALVCALRKAFPVESELLVILLIHFF